MKFRTTARKKARKRRSCPANDPKYKYAIMAAPEQQEAVPSHSSEQQQSSEGPPANSSYKSGIHKVFKPLPNRSAEKISRSSYINTLHSRQMITRSQTRDKLGTFDKEKVIKPYSNSIMDVKLLSAAIESSAMCNNKCCHVKSI